jgi:hypothetical protein
MGTVRAENLVIPIQGEAHAGSHRFLPNGQGVWGNASSVRYNDWQSSPQRNECVSWTVITEGLFLDCPLSLS